MSTTNIERTVSKSFREHFSFSRRVKSKEKPSFIRGLSAITSMLSKEVITSHSVEARLSCDFNQQMVCLTVSCNGMIDSTPYSFDNMYFGFSISGFIKGGNEEEITGGVKRVYTYKKAVLKGKYGVASCNWKGETLFHPREFPCWLPGSDFKMVISDFNKREGTAMLSIEGYVEFEIERTDNVVETIMVTRPSSSNTVTRPSSSNTVTRPSSSNTVTRPSSSNTVTRPSSGTTVSRSPKYRTHTEKTVSRLYTMPFYYKGEVNILKVGPMLKERRGLDPKLSSRYIVKANLSCDFKQQRVCLSLNCGIINRTSRVSLEEVKVYFPISDFIKEGNNVKNKGNAQMLSVPIDAVLIGEYEEVSKAWNIQDPHPTGFPSWLPDSNFGMEIHMDPTNVMKKERTAILTLKGYVNYKIERTDQITYRTNAPKPNVGEIVVDKEKAAAIGGIMSMLLNQPVVKNVSKLTNGSLLTCIGGSQRMIPDIELTPFNGLLFRYEDVFDGKGGYDGKLGFVNLRYELKMSQPGIKYLSVEVDRVRLNLKTSQGIVQLDGEVNPMINKLTFNLKDEAVKIAFLNLISQMEANQCDVDVFFKFMGYGHKIIGHGKEFVLHKSPPNANRRFKPEFVVVKKGEKRTKAIDNEESFMMRSFKVKLNKCLCYPIEKYPDLYLYFFERIEGNPFKLNDNFAEYKEIFCPGIDCEIVRVYKSLFSTNNFLLFPQKYYLARNADQFCISSNMFLVADEDSVSKSVISKVDFSFSIAPTLSRFYLAKLKLSLIENGMLDDELPTEEARKNPFDRIRFNFPNDIGTETKTDGDEFLATAKITKDGHYFDLYCETENIDEANRFLVAMEGGVYRAFNIVSNYKDILISSVVNLDMNQTIGDFLTLEIKDDEIVVQNKSYSPCRISNILLLNEEGEAFFNNSYFKGMKDLNSNERLSVRIADLTDKPSFMHPKEVFAEYESIEDFSKEIFQDTGQLTGYYREMVLDLSSIDDDKVETIQINVKHVASGVSYPFKKMKSQFKQPIQLTIITKYEREPLTQLEILRTYYDQNGYIIGQDTLEWDYSRGTMIDLSLSKQE